MESNNKRKSKRPQKHAQGRQGLSKAEFQMMLDHVMKDLPGGSQVEISEEAQAQLHAVTDQVLTDFIKQRALQGDE